MKSLLSILLFMIFGACIAQKAYKGKRTNYLPKSYRGGSLMWLEIGPSMVFANVIDKASISAKAKPAYGFGMRSKQLINRETYTYINVSLFSTEPKEVSLDIAGHERLKETFSFVNINAGISFYMIGNDKSKFAFAPIAFGLGIMSYNYNYDFSKPSVEDGNIVGINFGISSESSIHFKFEKFYLFMEGEFFSSLSNGAVFHYLDPSIGYLPSFKDEYKPNWYAAMLHIGVRYNL